MKSLEIVHLCMTPLAGAPIRIVQALNRFTKFRARLVNLNPDAYGTRVYEEDIDFRKSRAEAEELIKQADIVHLHHRMELVSNPFNLDLSHKLVVRQFHSEPAFVAKHSGVTAERLINDPLPQLVIAQFHERYYPRARPVPNLINYDEIDNALQARRREDAKRMIPKVLFSPTTSLPAGSDRWNTKGAPETLALLRQMAVNSKIEVDFFNDLPLRSALQRKAQCDLAIDEMVTGSYHLSGLEALALGKPTFGYLDQRMISVLVQLTGSTSLPWINVHLSQAKNLIEAFSEDPQVRQHVGASSFRWMRSFWRTEQMVQHYVKAYEEVLQGRKEMRNDAIDVVSDRLLPDYHWIEMTNLIQRQ